MKCEKTGIRATYKDSKNFEKEKTLFIITTKFHEEICCNMFYFIFEYHFTYDWYKRQVPYSPPTELVVSGRVSV